MAFDKTGKTRPGGSEGEFQFNKEGRFEGSSTLVVDEDTDTITIDNLQVDGNAIIDGNLTVKGTTVSVNSESLNIGDNHIYLNAANTSTIPETGALIVNIGAVSPLEEATVTNGTFAPGVDSGQNPFVETVETSVFSVNDIVQVSDNEKNNGIYEVLSHVSHVLSIRGIGTTPTVEEWTDNQFVADTDDAAKITKVNVSVLLTNSQGEALWGESSGSETSIASPFVFDRFNDGKLPYVVGPSDATINYEFNTIQAAVNAAEAEQDITSDAQIIMVISGNYTGDVVISRPSIGIFCWNSNTEQTRLDGSLTVNPNQSGTFYVNGLFVSGGVIVNGGTSNIEMSVTDSVFANSDDHDVSPLTIINEGPVTSNLFLENTTIQEFGSVVGIDSSNGQMNITAMGSVIEGGIDYSSGLPFVRDIQLDNCHIEGVIDLSSSAINCETNGCNITVATAPCFELTSHIGTVTVIGGLLDVQGGGDVVNPNPVSPLSAFKFANVTTTSGTNLDTSMGTRLRSDGVGLVSSGTDDNFLNATGDYSIPETIYTADAEVTGNRKVTLPSSRALTLESFDAVTLVTAQNSGDIVLSPTGISLTYTDLDGAGGVTGLRKIVIDSSGMTVTDTSSNKGLEYALDYSAQFVDRSLIDKGFADGRYVQGISVADNRLVTWDGAAARAIQDNTTITADGTTITGAAALTLTTTAGNVTLSGATNILKASSTVLPSVTFQDNTTNDSGLFVSTGIPAVTPANGFLDVDITNGEFYIRKSAVWQRFFNTSENVVIGPSTSISGEIPYFDNATGNSLESDSGFVRTAEGAIALSPATDNESAELILRNAAGSQFGVLKTSAGGDATPGIELIATTDLVIKSQGGQLDIQTISSGALNVTGAGIVNITGTLNTIKSTLATNPAVNLKNSADLESGIFISNGIPGSSPVDGFLDVDVTNGDFYIRKAAAWTRFATVIDTVGSSQNTEVIFNNNEVLTGNSKFRFVNATNQLWLGDGTGGNSNSGVLIIPRSQATSAESQFPNLFAAIHTIGSNSEHADIFLENFTNSPGDSASLWLDRSRVGSVTVNNGDFLGKITFRGFPGSSVYGNGARIHAEISDTGTVSTTSMPTDLVFSTSANGSENPTERVRILENGNTGVGTSDAQVLFHVQANNTGAQAIPGASIGVFENTGDCDICVLGGAANSKGIFFGDRQSASGPTAGGINYTGTGSTGRLNFVANNNQTKMAILADTGNVGIGTITPESLLHVEGSFGVRRRFASSSTVTNDEVIMGLDSTSGAITFSIQPVDFFAGRLHIIKDEGGFAGTNNITIKSSDRTISGSVAGLSGTDFVTSSVHNYVTGQVVFHSGMSVAAYDGLHTVTDIVSTTVYEVAALTFAGGATGTSNIAIDNTGESVITADYGAVSLYITEFQMFLW